MDKSELAIATSQIQNPIPFLIELLFNLLSQMITVSTIKLTSQPVSYFPQGLGGDAGVPMIAITTTLVKQRFQALDKCLKAY